MGTVRVSSSLRTLPADIHFIDQPLRFRCCASTATGHSNWGSLSLANVNLGVGSAMEGSKLSALACSCVGAMWGMGSCKGVLGWCDWVGLDEDEQNVGIAIETIMFRFATLLAFSLSPKPICSSHRIIL